MSINFTLLNKFWKNKNIMQDFNNILTNGAKLNREFQITDIDNKTSENIEAFIRFWNQLDEEQNIPIEQRLPIKIYINSNGGSLTASLTIIDVIRMSKTPIYTINIGTVYNESLFIFITGDKRFTYPSSTFSYYTKKIKYSQNVDNEFKNFIDFYDSQLQDLKYILFAHTKITKEKYQEIKNNDFWFFADQAIELGVCDEIINKFI